jgi:hypothetical protein
MSFFFVWWSFLLLSCHIYVLQTSESKNGKKKIKNFNLGSFFYQMRAPAGLPFLVPVPVYWSYRTVTGFCRPQIQNLNFGPVFVVTGQTGGDRFQRRYGYFNPCI